MSKILPEHLLLVSAAELFLPVTGFVILLTAFYARLSDHGMVIGQHGVAFACVIVLGILIGATPLELVFVFGPTTLTIATMVTCLSRADKAPLGLSDNPVQNEAVWKA